MESIRKTWAFWGYNGCLVMHNGSIKNLLQLWNREHHHSCERIKEGSIGQHVQPFLLFQGWLSMNCTSHWLTQEHPNPLSKLSDAFLLVQSLEALKPWPSALKELDCLVNGAEEQLWEIRFKQTLFSLLLSRCILISLYKVYNTCIHKQLLQWSKLPYPQFQCLSHSFFLLC